MARTGLVITVDTRTPFNLQDAGATSGQVASKNTKLGRPLLRKLVRFLDGVLCGGVDASHVTVAAEGGQPVAASGQITMNAGNVGDTVSINGAAITAVAGATTGDQWDQSGNATAEAVSMAATINASTTALIQKHVEASNFAATVAFATCTAGTKVLIGAHEFTAIAAANSTPQKSYGGFDISGNDTADGAAFAAAVNAHPVLCHDLVAINSSGTVTLYQRRGTAAYAVITKSAIPGVTPSGVTITQFASGAVVNVSALNPDHSGNAITIAESSGGARQTVSGARLTGGTGGASGTLTRVILGARAN